MDRNDIIKKVFPHSLFGYDPIAVDAFLDEVIRELDRLNNTVDVLRFRLAHELGDAMQQNERLSVELEYAEFGRRVNDFIAPPEDQQELPAPETVQETEISEQPEHGAEQADVEQGAKSEICE